MNFLAKLFGISPQPVAPVNVSSYPFYQVTNESFARSADRQTHACFDYSHADRDDNFWGGHSAIPPQLKTPVETHSWD